MSLESNKKKYNELVADYNAKYNEMVKALRETGTPEYMVDHLAKTFLVNERYNMGMAKAFIDIDFDNFFTGS